jgi:hypothetical protein
MSQESHERPVAATVVALLWISALWKSWECQGLYSDGSEVLVEILGYQHFIGSFFTPRAYAVFVSEAPAVVALKLGVVDLHWLARFLTFGYFLLPTAFYSWALVLARRDRGVLAITVAAIAIVFMTTSFHIGLEAHAAYAAAILIAVRLVTAPRLGITDGVTLVVVAFLSTRLYEHYAYLGPLLALMTLWAIARAPARPALATMLYGIAAVFLVVGTVIAARSLLDYQASEEDRTYMNGVVGSVWDFRFNILLDLLLLAASLFLAWGLLRPADLDRPWPYCGAGLVLLLAALTPLLVFAGRVVHPTYGVPQFLSRTVAGPLAAAVIATLWLYASRRGGTLAIVRGMKRPRAAWSCLMLALGMFGATLPWDTMLTLLYGRYLDVVRETIRGQGGLIEADRSLLRQHPRATHQDFTREYLSLVMRSRPGDGVLLSDGDRASGFDATLLPDLGKYFWRD